MRKNGERSFNAAQIRSEIRRCVQYKDIMRAYAALFSGIVQKRPVLVTIQISHYCGDS